MLKNTTPQVKIFKITTAEEIIATMVDEDNTHYTVEHPLQLAPGRNGVQFAPYLFMADTEKKLSLNRNTVVAVAPPNADVEQAYKSALSGIALPKQSGIITQ